MSDYGIQERKWGEFPTLRVALQDKRIPDEYYGPTSASKNIFNRLECLLEVSILAFEHADLVKETARSVGQEGMQRDLNRLRDELDAAAAFFRQQAEDVRSLNSKL